MITYESASYDLK